MITLLLGGCSNGGTAPAARVSPTPLPSGLTLACTDRYDSSHAMGPLQDGGYAHFVCHDGKVTAWWIDGSNDASESPPH